MESAAPFFAFMLFIGFFGLIFWLIFKYAKRNIEKMNVEFETIAYNLDAYVTPAKSIWKKPHPMVDGKINGRNFQLYMFTRGSGKNQVTYTAFKIDCSARGNTLALYPEGFFSKVGKFFGMQDIQMGDPFFDEKYIIKSNNETFVYNKLQGDLRQQLTYYHPKIKGTFKIDDMNTLKYEEVVALNNPVDRARFEELLQLGVQIAEVVET